MFNGFLQGDTNEDNGSLQNQFVAPISTPNPRVKKHLISRFLLWSLILTILVAAGAYAFTVYLDGQTQAEQQSLANIDKSKNVTEFGQNLPQMETLSKKLQLINSIYDSKQYFSAMLFPILESEVESTPNSYVYFKSFSTKKEYGDNLLLVSLSGVALDYPTLYRQVNDFKFGKYSKLITNFQLGSFTKDAKGNIDFDLSFDIDVSTPSYLNFLKESLGLGTASSSSNTVQSGPLYNDLDNSNGSSEQANATTSSDTEDITNSTTTTDNQSDVEENTEAPTTTEEFNTNGQVD